MRWFSWLKRKKWALVKVLSATISVGKHEGTMNFYLYEAKDESRKIETKHNIKTIAVSSNFNGISLFTEKIYPWLKGMHFYDIPSYWDIEADNNKRYIRHMYARLLKGGPSQ